MTGRLTALQLAALRTLAAAGEDWTPSSVDGRPGTVVSTTVASLERRELAERRPPLSHWPSRRAFYRLTDAGREVVTRSALRDSRNA